MSEYKCNLVIPGFPKSGTSSLHSYLDTHSEICMSSSKEPHFFSIDERWNRGSSYHNNLFKHCTKNASVFGESSTTYCITEEALTRIGKSLHAPKIIFLLREPVSRAISHYKWLFALGLENRSFLDAIKASGYDFSPNNSIRGNYTGYLEFSTISKWVPRWQTEFGAENVLLLNSEDLKYRTIKTLDSCAVFLGIERIDWKLPEEKNRTEDISMVSENAGSNIAKLLIPKWLKQNVRERVPGLVGTWNGVFISHIQRPPPHLTDKDLYEVHELLSSEYNYYCSLFKITPL